MPRETLRPGETVQNSGIYQGSKSGEKTTLVAGKTAPPQEKGLTVVSPWKSQFTIQAKAPQKRKVQTETLPDDIVVGE